MSTFNFNGEIRSEHLQIGDHNHMEVSQGASSAETVSLVAELVRLLRQEAPHLVPTAQAVQSELAAPDEGGRPHRGRIKALLQQIPPGLAAGSAALTLVHQLQQVFSG